MERKGYKKSNYNFLGIFQTDQNNFTKSGFWDTKWSLFYMGAQEMPLTLVSFLITEQLFWNNCPSLLPLNKKILHTPLFYADRIEEDIIRRV